MTDRQRDTANANPGMAIYPNTPQDYRQPAVRHARPGHVLPPLPDASYPPDAVTLPAPRPPWWRRWPTRR